MINWQTYYILYLQGEMQTKWRKSWGKELGKRMASALQEKGMTQRSLAQRVCVSEAVISRYISGEREPKPEMLALFDAA